MLNNMMLGNLVSYLTHGFAEWFGEPPGATFDVQPGGTLTANITALTPEGQHNNLRAGRWRPGPA